jgi:hypothetical protein
VVILPEAAKCGKVKFAELREITQVLHRISTAASIFTLVTPELCTDFLIDWGLLKE